MSDEMNMTTMTIPEILSKFEHDLPDEIHDSNKYLDMAKAAEEMHHYKLAKGLYLAGYDEYTHAKFIYDTLLEHNGTIKDDCRKMFDELSQRIHKIF